MSELELALEALFKWGYHNLTPSERALVDEADVLCEEEQWLD